jgi:hypothetical protein
MLGDLHWALLLIGDTLILCVSHSGLLLQWFCTYCHVSHLLGTTFLSISWEVPFQLFSTLMWRILKAKGEIRDGAKTAKKLASIQKSFSLWPYIWKKNEILVQEGPNQNYKGLKPKFDYLALSMGENKTKRGPWAISFTWVALANTCIEIFFSNSRYAFHFHLPHPTLGGNYFNHFAFVLCQNAFM